MILEIVVSCDIHTIFQVSNIVEFFSFSGDKNVEIYRFHNMFVCCIYIKVVILFVSYKYELHVNILEEKTKCII